jgi:hypothetical protein
MSTPEAESFTLKLRSIEVAIDNFRSRMQGSFNSQVSLIRDKFEKVSSRFNSVASKTGLQEVGTDLSAIIQESRGILQKDILHDTIELVHEKLAELEGIMDRLKTLQTDESTLEKPAIPEQRMLRKSNLISLVTSASETNDEYEDKDMQIASLREEVNRLYNLTEREPRFQPFWILRDAHPNSVAITKIARTLNAAPTDVLENLRIFERLGLIEIKGGEARATKLIRPNNPEK